MRRERVKKMLGRTLALNLALVLGITAAGCTEAKQQTGESTGSQAAEEVSPKDSLTEEPDANEMNVSGRYVEEFADLPEGSGSPGQSMTLLENGTLAYFDGKENLYTAEMETLFSENAEGVWESRPQFLDLPDSYIEILQLQKTAVWQ